MKAGYVKSMTFRKHFVDHVKCRECTDYSEPLEHMPMHAAGYINERERSEITALINFFILKAYLFCMITVFHCREHAITF